MQIFMNVPAISNEVYASFGSSRRSVIRFAAECCFVFNMFTSLLVRENKANFGAGYYKSLIVTKPAKQ